MGRACRSVYFLPRFFNITLFLISTSLLNSPQFIIIMFGFLKDKLKSVVSKFSKQVEEESELEEVKEEKVELPKEIKSSKDKSKKESKKTESKKETIKKEKSKIESPKEKEIEIQEKIEEVKEKIEEQKESKGFFGKLKDKFSKTEEVEVEKPKIEEVKEDTLQVQPITVEEKKGFFGSIKEKITTTKISKEKFNELFNELEFTMLENNVALEVIDKIKEDLIKDIVDKPIKRNSVEESIKNSLKESIQDLFILEQTSLINKIESSNKKPYVICFVGQNGSGKTTSIAKITNYLQKNKKSVVLAAADTFRAAAIQQIKEWGSRLNVKVIAHDYGSDPAAVCFDAVEYAKSHNLDIVLIDTAGRQHSNANLMQEMEKITRVSKPDLKIFVGESITGNDALEQSQHFNNSIGIDGIILTKADIDEKGGAIISVSYVTHKPILFLGTGQNLNDIKEFNKEEIIKNLGL